MVFISTNEFLGTDKIVKSDFGTTLKIIDAVGKATKGHIRRTITEVNDALAEYDHVLVVCTLSVRHKLKSQVVQSIIDVSGIEEVTADDLKSLASF